jgi:hypothetical protein
VAVGSRSNAIIIMIMHAIMIMDYACHHACHQRYANSRSAGKLFVFTITASSGKHAPGSPYTIVHPLNIIVLPKT